MKASTERKLLRWLHLVLSIPLVGYLYGPVARIPRAAFAVRFVLFPLVVLTGLWMWKGQQLKRWVKKRRIPGSIVRSQAI
jgi:thiosulfate reductase cytochrome b subunit